MPHKLALIHTGSIVVPIFNDICREVLPGVSVFHMLDESLLKNTIAAGRLEKATIRRLANLVGAAADGGADAVLVTCSSIGPAVEVARQLFDFPIFRVDEGMAEEAVRLGRRIGVIATLRSTLEPTVNLLLDTASKAGAGSQVESCLCEGAFEAVASGNAALHDQLVSDALRRLASTVDVIVLAQASMARVARQLSPGAAAVPILSSPRLAVERVKQAIGA
ncbi:MAG: aspartate/glutamate racemase family protein [Bryobacteraceae bacterium]